MNTNTLPPEFRNLENCVSAWALPEYNARWQKRLGSSYQELQAFYDRLQPQMPAIIEFLNERPLKTLTPEEQSLLHLAEAFMEVSIAVEYFHAPDEPGVFPASRVVLERFDSRV